MNEMYRLISKINYIKTIKLTYLAFDGNVAEWLRRGLQILVSQFDSGRCLQKKELFSFQKKVS